jgi:hypothetical protein
LLDQVVELLKGDSIRGHSISIRAISASPFSPSNNRGLSVEAPLRATTIAFSACLVEREVAEGKLARDLFDLLLDLGGQALHGGEH